jgi:diguanylate cyclase (GGDEF)-like protein
MPLTRPSPRDALLAIGFVLLYAAGGHLSNLLVAGPEEIVLVWIPAGLSLGLLLLRGRHWWPAVAAAEMVFEVTVGSVSAAFVVGTMVANTLAAWLATLVMERWVWREDRRFTVRTGLALGGGAAVTAVVSALIGSSTLWLAGYIPQAAWPEAAMRWALANFFGSVVFTSPLLLVGESLRQPQREWPGGGHRRGEIMVFATVILVCLALPFLQDMSESRYPMGLLGPIIMLLCWSAIRFPPLLTAVASLIVASSMVIVIGLQLGSFPQPEAPADVILLLVMLSAVAAMPQVLAAAVNDAQRVGRRLVRQAFEDVLTGLPNRQGFEAATAERTRAGDGRPVALAYLDVDNFKLINDNASHQAGDEFVAGLANALRTVVGRDDVLGRLSGDKFVALLVDRDEAEALAVAEQLRKVVADFRFLAEGHLFVCTASIGLAHARSGEMALPALLSLADAACFAAKELGGNRVERARMGADAHEQRQSAMRWAVRLNSAFEKHHFQLYCQAIEPLWHGGSHGAHLEVLLRLRDPDTGQMVPPAQFIAAAERFRMSARLDTYVVDTLLRFFEQRPWLLARVELVAINLSGASVNDGEFLRFLKRRISSSPVPPQKLCFEITETAAVRDLDDAQHFIGMLRELGCRLALDDFGAGFCSFAYLRALDVDYFKIDGSFVRDLDSSPLSVAIVRAIADIARSLGKQCIGEFVESESVRQRLIALGVDFAQGYALHRPEPLAQFLGDRDDHAPATPAQGA